MKKIGLILIACFFVMGVMFAANGNCGDGVKWSLSRDGVLVISGKGPMKNFGGSRPWRPDFVKRALIEEGVTSIGKNTFNGCKNLVDVSISNSVLSIGEEAFRGCENLAYVVIPGSVEEIKKNAFANCKSLGSVELKFGCVTIEESAFMGCSSLATLYVPESVRTIGKDAFKNCSYLNNITSLPDFVTMQSSSFYGLNAAVVSRYISDKEQEKMYAEARGRDVIPSKPVNENGKGSEIKADVDLFVPQTDKVNENTFVVIIANEAYQKLAKVNYAIKDGQSFAEYCHFTLGIPHENIRTYHNATYGRMLEAVSDLKSISGVYGSEMNVIFYYCGHGAPDEATKESFLLPVDAFKVSPNVCLSLKKLYSDLADLKVGKVTVFLDACFSGATRAGGMLASARGTAMAPRAETLAGNVVTFTASSGSETALQYDEKGHGMFTYYLLKKLQESKGDVSMGELCEYVKKKVLQKSVVVNRKKQTPTLDYAPELEGSWHNWKLK